MIRFKHIALSGFVIAALTAPSLCWAQDLPFSEAIEANGVIYLSGHLGDDDKGIFAKSMGAQTTATLENIGKTLKTENANYSDIVRCQVFMTDIAKFSEMNAAYRKFFPKNPPTRTTIGGITLALPEALVEIECTAVRGHGARLQAPSNKDK